MKYSATPARAPENFTGSEAAARATDRLPQADAGPKTGPVSRLAVRSRDRLPAGQHSRGERGITRGLQAHNRRVAFIPR